MFTAEAKHSIKDKNFNELENFFYFTWLAMTHRNSLDSYRVKCMNSLNILRELSELSAKKLPHINESIAMCIDEAIDILDKDLVVKLHYQHVLTELIGVLKKIKSLIEENKKEKNQPIIDKYHTIFRHISKSITQDIVSYKVYSLEMIKLAIDVAQNFDDIQKITQSLVSVLVDDGFTLESLFQMARSVFLYSDKKYSFSECFEYLKKIILRGSDLFKIYFPLNNPVIKDLVPEALSDVKILYSGQLPDFSGQTSIVDFVESNKDKYFAEILIQSIDAGTASLAAREKVYDVIDLIRFSFNGRIDIYGSNFIFTRSSDGISKLLKIPDIIPNPKVKFTLSDTKKFTNDTLNLLYRNEIDKAAKGKIQSAFRFYRVGRDSRFYPNKFVNWWTALEYLVDCKDGSIIDSVKKTAIDILGLCHVAKYLQSLIHYIKISDPKDVDDLNSKLEIQSLGDITPIVLYDALKDSEKYKTILGSVQHHTLCRRRVQYLHEIITDYGKLGEFVNHHEVKLGWHLSRLYRVRCDIIHSASYSLNIVLLCANLEYYLKTVVRYVISRLVDDKFIFDLHEIYDVAEYEYFNLKEAIKEKKEFKIKSVIQGCSFDLSI